MKHALVVARYKVREEPEEHESLLSAVKAALDVLDGDEAWPVSITKVGTGAIVWEQSGPTTTHESLVRLREYLERWPAQ